MTLRIEAGDSVMGRWRERLREPTGSPVVRYDSTICLKMVRERSLSFCSSERLPGALGRLNGLSVLMERM
jgi:hypothetical protein